MGFCLAPPVTTSGYDAIVVVVDRLSKMIHAIPTVTTVSTPASALLAFADLICDPAKVRVIVEWPEPAVVSSLRPPVLPGLADCYRRLYLLRFLLRFSLRTCANVSWFLFVLVSVSFQHHSSLGRGEGWQALISPSLVIATVGLYVDRLL